MVMERHLLLFDMSWTVQHIRVGLAAMTHDLEETHSVLK